MLQKLFSLVDQTSVPDNPDALQNQEVLQAGQLISIYLKVLLFTLNKSHVILRAFLSPSILVINGVIFIILCISLLPPKLVRIFLWKLLIQTLRVLPPHSFSVEKK